MNSLPFHASLDPLNPAYLSPDLARLIGSFIYKNLGMVFILTNDPLSRGFDLLEELYYDNLSFAALVPYALKQPRTRTGAVILLCLAASYEFERRVILSIDDSRGAAKRVLADPSDDSIFVYNRSVKAYVLREVYRDFASELSAFIGVYMIRRPRPHRGPWPHGA